ncbi:MAG: glutamate--tRNA ligase [Candidatus Aminicenantes bacterium]|nr:glutamate--tRNA ligase [Candidatus Aminicenantes bacterium]
MDNQNPPDNKFRVRFAPSPTGYLHVGNARTALFNWLFARRNNGVFILRIEDTDVERSKEEYAARLIDDLNWLGLDWDEGPDIEGEFGPYRQSLRKEIYAKYTQKLLHEEKAYYCFCSAEELEKERKKAIASGAMPVYSGRCRALSREESEQRLSSGERAVVRLKTPRQGELKYMDLVRGLLSFNLELIGDPVLVRSNGLPAYNYAVVIDDALMKISHVIRGEDHISNTPRQLLTYEALGFKSPVFAHLSMVMGQDNTRLSKRHGATSVDQFEKQGILPEALFNYLSLLGWAPPDGQEVLISTEIIKLFDINKVSRHSAVFDYNKLYWLNRQHLKKLPAQQKVELAYDRLQAAGMLPPKMKQDQWDWLKLAVASLIEKIDTLSDLPAEFALFFEFSPEKLDPEAQAIFRSTCGRQVLDLFYKKVKQVDRFDYSILTEMAEEIKKETGCKGRELFHPIRVALTARHSGLDLDKFVPLVEAGSRLNFPVPIKSCFQRVNEIYECVSRDF